MIERSNPRIVLWRLAFVLALPWACWRVGSPPGQRDRPVPVLHSRQIISNPPTLWAENAPPLSERALIAAGGWFTLLLFSPPRGGHQEADLGSTL